MASSKHVENGIAIMSVDKRGALALPHGAVSLPAFLPDATHGVVRAVDSLDLEQCGVQALVMNTFHLMQRPGSSAVEAIGGLHALSGWRRPIVTDSGGFQAYSLIRQNARYGHLTEKGLAFQPEGATRRFLLTPEKSIQLQVSSYASDVVVCLDDCTHVDEPPSRQRESVERTIAWARRGKAEFVRLVEQKKLPPERRPLLFAVVQGGGDFALRRACAEALLEIGFDGFGFGGWPLDSEGQLLSEIVAWTRELIPARFPLHGLGIGHPLNVVACARMGYDLFDSAMPTRDARHARLYCFTEDPTTSSLDSDGTWFSYVYLSDERLRRERRPVSAFCDCLCCSRYSLAYLHHLFKVNDALFLRLATIHNLRFMMQLMQRLGMLLHGERVAELQEQRAAQPAG
ncbi:tRNA guanosine(34) transglycosylase Tgt [Thermogemmatispora sp.]|uniref:tRNA-ribosyltransferase family protein n=1 Tax=Thermogemmatispora sp. TaxID=1968838 RepID=UPI002627A6BB|nr:tRNA guanosine(34) transglycosylase Tgt [Thermogemmatispora sp.]